MDTTTATRPFREILAAVDRDLGEDRDPREEAVEAAAESKIDFVNHPPHYTTHPSGVECITIVEHMTFCQGNAIKYAWRAYDKGNAIEDFEKAAWYAKREADRLRKMKGGER